MIAINKGMNQTSQFKWNKTFSFYLKTMSESSTWYGTKILSPVGNGIEFKTKRGRGNYAVLIHIDMNDEKVAAWELFGDKNFSTNLKSKKMNIIRFTLNQTDW